MKNLSFAALLLFTGPLLAQQSQDKTYEFPVSNPANPVMLEVEIHNGKVIIQGADTDTISITAKSRPLDESEMADVRREQKVYWVDPKGEQQSKTPRSREGLTPVDNNAINVQIDQRGNQIEVESLSTTFYLELVINVPRLTNVEGSIYRGDGISVSDIQGYLELESWKGDIIAERVSGPVVAETSQNSIIVNFSEFSDVSPSSLTTHNGDIDITVDKEMSANINVQNFQGEVLSGLSVPFEATEQVKRDERQDRREIVIGGQLTARMNNGGQDLTLITYSGGVYIRTQ